MNQKMTNAWLSVCGFMSFVSSAAACKVRGVRAVLQRKEMLQGVVPESRITGVEYYRSVDVEDAVPDTIEQDLTTLFRKESIEECAPVVVIGENDTQMHVLNDDEQLDMFLAQIRARDTMIVKIA